MTLTEFLRARLAEDESEGRTALAMFADSPDVTRQGAARQFRRYLAEVDARRRIVELHSDSEDGHCCVDPEEVHIGEKMFWGEPCDTLRLLALPYADHPDYNEDWKP